jgi:hypothetical protein
MQIQIQIIYKEKRKIAIKREKMKLSKTWENIFEIIYLVVYISNFRLLAQFFLIFSIFILAVSNKHKILLNKLKQDMDKAVQSD